MKALWFLVMLVCLSSCAPMMVTRTPEPAAPGTLDVTIAAGYPTSLTTIPGCGEVAYSCSEGFIPADYYPRGSAFGVTLSQGLAGDTELNYSLLAGQPFGLPFFRFGGKTLVYDDEVKLAADYGFFLGLYDTGLDAGVLASLPVEGAELYGALRGFGTYYPQGYASYNGGFNIVGALTVGVEATAPGIKGLFAELTFATSGYNGVDVTRLPDDGGPPVVVDDIQQLGFSILPAVGIRF